MRGKKIGQERRVGRSTASAAVGVAETEPLEQAKNHSATRLVYD